MRVILAGSAQARLALGALVTLATLPTLVFMSAAAGSAQQLPANAGAVAIAQSAPAADLRPADPEPDAITRGQSTVVTVKGSSLDALKTLTIEPAAGVRLGAIEPLPGQADGSQAVRVTITVDANAAPGDRDIMLTIAPTVSMSAPRTGDSNGDTALRMDELRRSIIARETRPMAVGSIHVNGHDIKVARASFVRNGESVTAAVVVEDAQDDLGDRPSPPVVFSGGSGGLELVPVSDPLTIEARCGAGDRIDLLPAEVKIDARRGASMITVTLDAEDLAGQSNCEIRVRAEDAEGNLSPWFVTHLTGR